MIGHFADADAEARFRAAYAEGMARMPPPSSTAVIPTEFGQVHVHRFGSAPGTPLVLLPAGAGRVTEPDRFCVRVLALAEDRCGVVGYPARGPNFLRTRMSSWISGGVGRRHIPPTTSCALSTFRRRR